MLRFAYEAVRENGRSVRDPRTGERFLSTRYSVVEAFTRDMHVAIVQAGICVAPYTGVVARALAQDERRDGVPPPPPEPATADDPPTPANAKHAKAKEPPALAETCAQCGAKPSARCSNYKGQPCAPHGARIRAAKAVAHA